MRARKLQPELMDDPKIDLEEHREALRALARLNRASRAAAPIQKAIRALVLKSQRGNPLGPTTGIHDCLDILDIATGSGDVALGVSRALVSSIKHIRVRLCDISPVALAEAQDRFAAASLQAQPGDWQVTFDTIQADVVSRGIPLPDQSVDVAMCSLFVHHLTESSGCLLLAEMARVARRLVVVSDLRRSATGLIVARCASRLAGSRVARIDAPRSVEGALTIAELISMARTAGLSGAEVRPIWPWRMLLTFQPSIGEQVPHTHSR